WGPEHREDLATLDVQRELSHGLEVSKLLRDPVEPDARYWLAVARLRYRSSVPDGMGVAASPQGAEGRKRATCLVHSGVSTSRPFHRMRPCVYADTWIRLSIASSRPVEREESEWRPPPRPPTSPAKRLRAGC